MKRLLIYVLSGAFFFTLCGCQKSGTASSFQTDSESSSVVDSGETNTQLANPWTDFDSLEKAAKAAGFGITVPSEIMEQEMGTISVSREHILQICYGSDLIVRKAKTLDDMPDLSGDHTKYDQEYTLTVEENELSVRGDADDKIHVVVWQREGYTYAVQSTGGLSAGLLDIMDLYFDIE